MLTVPKKPQGFTIIELLIVIVIIAILAAITLVAYNNIQTRAKTAAAKNVASEVQQKVETYNALKGSYPSSNLTSDLSTYSESSLAGTGITIAGPYPTTITPSTGTKAVKVDTCSNPSGYRVFYWDYGAPDQTGQNALVLQGYGGVSSSSDAVCTSGWNSAY